MKNFKYCFFIISAMISSWSCSEDLLNTTPNDRISTEVFWKTDLDATYAANAVYTFMDSPNEFVVWDAMSDIGHITLQWRDESIMEKGSYDATMSVVYNRWSNAYTGIQNANIFLDKVGLIKTTNKALIDRLTMEVRVLRAYYYINLAFLYGDVPLVTTETTLDVSRKLTRTPVAEVWNFISKELTEAAAGLPNIQTEKGRITKGAALALKARALLYAGRYTDAAAAAKEVMDLGIYSLYPSYQNLFSYAAENSSEVILDKQYIKDVLSNNIFNLTTPNSIWPQVNSFVPTKRAVDAYAMNNGKEISDPTSGFDPLKPYSNRDPRLKFSIYTLGDLLPNNKIYDPRPNSGTGDAIGSSENSTFSGFNAKKYINKEDLATPNNCGINIILLRYAEVLLTYAEAKIEANSIDPSVLSAINLVRARSDVNMPAIIGTPTQSELRKIVRDERLVELAFEGLRYFDIRRWRIAETVIPGIIYGMTYADQNGVLTTIALTGFNKAFNKNRDYLWPIPQRERELNPSLTQNPNW
jgi:hypothetical protein